MRIARHLHASPPLRRALRGGVLAALLTQLAMAALSAPLLSVHSWAAHAHDDDHPHVHPLTELFANGPVQAAVRSVAVDPVAPRPAPAIAAQPPQAAPWPEANGARAPPPPPPPPSARSLA